MKGNIKQAVTREQKTGAHSCTQMPAGLRNMMAEISSCK